VYGGARRRYGGAGRNSLAAPMASANVQGSFDYGSRVTYFIALFLYFSLVLFSPLFFPFYLIYK